MAKRKLYSEPLKKVSDSATLFYLKGKNLVQPGWVRYVTFASCYDDTNTGTSIEFGKWAADRFVSMEGTSTLTKSVPVFFTRSTHHFLTGEIPTFRIVGADASDVIVGYLEGYETELEEIVTTG